MLYVDLFLLLQYKELAPFITVIRWMVCYCMIYLGPLLVSISSPALIRPLFYCPVCPLNYCFRNKKVRSLPFTYFVRRLWKVQSWAKRENSSICSITFFKGSSGASHSLPLPEPDSATGHTLLCLWLLLLLTECAACCCYPRATAHRSSCHPSMDQIACSAQLHSFTQHCFSHVSFPAVQQSACKEWPAPAQPNPAL